MVVKLYGYPKGGHTVTAAVILLEKNIPFKMMPIDIREGEHRSVEYRAMQPFGQLPCIDDNGFVMYECRAIARYLVDKYPKDGPALIPAANDVIGRARFEQAASVEVTNFQPHAFKIYVEGMRKVRQGIPKDQAAYDDAVSQLSATLDVYEATLAKQKFLAGDEITLVDLFHLAFGQLLAPSGCDLMTSKGPNVARWWKEVTSRPSLKNLQLGDDIVSTAE
ncbi:glutathione S-transferase [Roridomyces roridus]|uniref:glutathione transferase n=1 Tax=Roridomyces roridus TaxID=1738132 RepID=A0AAD7BQA7_9AGAR|nr:glutathione S-transferase [Roridomyces roridus]